MTGADKFCQLRPLLAKISDAASALGSELFRLVQEQLQHFVELLHMNHVPLVTDPSSTRAIERSPTTSAAKAPLLLPSFPAHANADQAQVNASNNDNASAQQPAHDNASTHPSLGEVTPPAAAQTPYQERHKSIADISTKPKYQEPSSPGSDVGVDQCVQHHQAVSFQLPSPQRTCGNVARSKKRKFLPCAAPRSKVDDAVLTMKRGGRLPTVKEMCEHLGGPISYERSTSFINSVRVHTFFGESDDFVSIVPATAAKNSPDDRNFILSEVLIRICKNKIESEIRRLRNSRAWRADAKRVVDVDEFDDLRDTIAVRVAQPFETSRRSIAIQHSWVYTCREVNAMAALHGYRNQLAQVEDTTGWCASLLTIQRDLFPRVNVVKILETIPLSYQIHVGDHYALVGELFTFARETWLNDVCITMSLQQLVVEYPGILVNPASHVVLPKHCSIPVDWFAVLKARFLFVPVNIGGKHWTLIAVDVQEETIILFDPLQCASTYDAMRKCCVGVIQDGLHATGCIRSPFRVRLLTTITQRDWFNCGVHVIHVARALTYGHSPNQLTIAALEQLRFELFGGLVARAAT